LNEEQSAPLSDIEIVAKEIDTSEAVLIVPVTIISEILDSKLSGDRKITSAFVAS
jgi:hypothetical protein